MARSITSDGTRNIEHYADIMSPGNGYPLSTIGYKITHFRSVCPSVYDGMDYYMDTSNSPNSIDMYCNNMRPTGIPW